MTTEVFYSAVAPDGQQEIARGLAEKLRKASFGSLQPSTKSARPASFAAPNCNDGVADKTCPLKENPKEKNVNELGRGVRQSAQAG